MSRAAAPKPNRVCLAACSRSNSRVVPGDLDVGHSVADLDAAVRTGPAGVVIGDVDLRDRPGQDPLHALPAEHQRRHPTPHRRRNRIAQQRHSGDPAGSSDQPLGHRRPLGGVGVQQSRPGLASDDGGQLPPQVETVGDAGVHPLRADHGVDVGSVADQEHPAPRMCFRATLVDPEPTGLPDLGDASASGGADVDRGLQLLQLYRSVGGHGSRGLSYRDAMPAAEHREVGDESAPVQEREELIVRERPTDVDGPPRPAGPAPTINTSAVSLIKLSLRRSVGR